jgi:hypothetical protein
MKGMDYLGEIGVNGSITLNSIIEREIESMKRWLGS